MITFACETRDASGSVVNRTVEAETRRDALRELQQDGLVPVRVQERIGPAADGPGRASPGAARGRVSGKELLGFTIQLSSAVRTGVPILAAIASIRRGARNERFRQVLGQMCTEIEGGMPLSGAMASHPAVFSEVYVNSVSAGEQSGKLDELLSNLAEFIEADLEVRADVRSAMLYPAIVMSTLLLAVTVLMLFVVPRFASLYDGLDTELPLPTRILVGGSTAVVDHALYVLAAGIVLAFVGFRLARTRRGRGALHGLLLRIPFLGKVLETAITLRVMQMIGLFSQAGLPILEGLRTIANTITNTRYRQDLKRVAATVATGETLSGSLEEADCFSPAVRQMIASGESTGSLEQTCFVLAGQFKKQLRHLTKNVATFIEPILTLFLAVIVLFVALATFLPMWDLVKAIRN